MNLDASIVFEKNWEGLQKGYKILENVGSSRSTKTWSFFQLIYLYSFQNKRKRTVVMRDTAIACRDLVETEFKDWMQDPRLRIQQFEKGLITGEELDKYLEEENLMKHVIENKTKHSYTFIRTGSVISFNGADNISRIIGKGNDIVWVNEPYEFPEEVMLQLLKRLRVALLLDWNPSKSHYIEAFRSRPDCLHIHSTFLDNPFLTDSVRNEILGNKPLDSDYFDFEVAQYIDWKRADIANDLKGKDQKVIDDVLRCYDNMHYKTANKYHWEVYGLGRKAEKPNRIFSWESISYADYLNIDAPIYYGCDWGKVDPWAVIEAKYHDGRLFVHELNYASENQWREKISNTERVNIDADQSDDVAKESGLVVWLFNRLNISKSSEIQCDTNRPLKIAALRRQGYRAMPALKGKIVDGIDLLQDLEVYYTNSSENIAYEQENYSYKVDKYGVVQDEPQDLDNHTMDAIRYIANGLRRLGVIRSV